ncbi:MAG: DUF3347 domain-containing protein [Bacteroidetes bacterium]|nr:DUF3347 domain-containing protein [Bacteroidota bacterium]
MKQIILSITILLFGYAAFAQNTNDILKKYISIKNALVNSDSKTAETAITNFYEGIKKEGNFTQKNDLLKATEKLSKAGNNLEKQRAAFNDVSATMWNFIKDAEKINQPVYYQYCPMKKANWLSFEEEIKNPYYGASMLNCGKVTDKKS